MSESPIYSVICPYLLRELSERLCPEAYFSFFGTCKTFRRKRFDRQLVQKQITYVSQGKGWSLEKIITRIGERSQDLLADSLMMEIVGQFWQEIKRNRNMYILLLEKRLSLAKYLIEPERKLLDKESEMLVKDIKQILGDNDNKLEKCTMAILARIEYRLQYLGIQDSKQPIQSRLVFYVRDVFDYSISEDARGHSSEGPSGFIDSVLPNERLLNQAYQALTNYRTMGTIPHHAKFFKENRF